MKKYLIFIYIHLISSILIAQNVYAPYGGVFTPRGELRALLVLVEFRDEAPFFNAEQGLDGWNPREHGGFPRGLDLETGEWPSLFFREGGRLLDSAGARFYNHSLDWYWASGGRFKFLGEVFRDSLERPCVVRISAQGLRDWSGANRRALEEMRLLNPNFDAGRFDRRKNNPQFKRDNALEEEADGEMDYVIFVYRYSRSWGIQPQRGMERWLGSGGGLASLGSMFLDGPFAGKLYTTGFTLMYNSSVFMHELAHMIYNYPHVFGANQVVGLGWQAPSCGWGTIQNIPIFMGLNAWEAWYLGWLEPKLVNLEAGRQRFWLGDFQMERGALRIPLPLPAGERPQYLWLEYHSGRHFLDQHPWRGMEIEAGYRLGEAPKGVMAYVEGLTDSREELIQSLNGLYANRLRPLHGDGHYDYRWRSDLGYEKNFWSNRLYVFERGLADATGGYHPALFFRADFNGDGKIALNTDANSASDNEHELCMRELIAGRDLRLYRAFGLAREEQLAEVGLGAMAFGVGQGLGLNYNPYVSNLQRYDSKLCALSPIYLHGLELRFLRYNEDSTAVLVELEDARRPRLRRGRHRWTGSLCLGPEQSLSLERGAKLLIDHSPLARRHLPNEQGGFDSPSVLRLSKGSTLHIKKGASLHIPPPGWLEIEKEAKLLVQGQIQAEIRYLE